MVHQNDRDDTEVRKLNHVSRREISNDVYLVSNEAKLSVWHEFARRANASEIETSKAEAK